MLKSRPDVEITGVCGLGLEQVRRVQELFDIPYGTEEYLELLTHGKPDGAVIVSPGHLHYEHALAALGLGIHVMCEKPMAVHPAEAKHLTALAEKRNLQFLIPYGWNYTKFAARAREFVAAGEIGKIEHVVCQMSSPLRDLMSGQGSWYATGSLVKPRLETWSEPVTGGGYAYGQVTHLLGLLLWVTGLEVEEVFAFMRTSETGVDLYDAITLTCKNGATGLVSGAATLPPGSPTQVDVRIFGSGGMILIDIERPRLEIHRNGGKPEVVAIDHPPGGYACREPVMTFIDLIQGKPAENRSSAVLGSNVVYVLEAAFRSAIGGKVCRVED